jgi:hypothetical protein
MSQHYHWICPEEKKYKISWLEQCGIKELRFQSYYKDVSVIRSLNLYLSFDL